MAEAPSLYAESLEKLDQELTCPICLKHFEEPKVLPCCHYYCRECIVQMQARTRGKDYFQCPECRKETRLPGNDPDSLLTAFFVNRMKELFSMMQKAQGKVELTCESCRRGTTPVEAFCRHCALFICQSCEEAHRTMRPFSDHVVVPLDDLRQNTSAHFPVKEEAQMKCKEHGGKKMKLYCYDCKQLICRDCIIKDHKEHEYEFINKAAVQCRASLKESMSPLRRIQASLSQAVVETEKATSAVSQSGVDIAAAIDLKFDELIASVQKRREELHREARETIEEKQKNLTAQRKNIQQATVEVQSMIEFVDHKSKRTNDQEMLGLQKQIHDRVNEVTQKYRNSAEQFKPTEVCHLELVYTSQLAVQTIILRCQGGKGSKGHGSHSSHDSEENHKSKSSIAAGATAEEELADLIAKIGKGKWKGLHIQAELYKAPSCICLKCIDTKRYDEDIISMYFESPRSKGGKVKQVQLLGNGEAVVTFEDPTVIDHVLGITHTTLGANVTVERSFGGDVPKPSGALIQPLPTPAAFPGGWGRGHGNRSKSFYGGTATEEDWDTNLLFSPAGTDHMANFQSMSDPASSTWVVSSTATSGTMTYSQATAAGGGGGGVPVSTFNTSVGTVTYSQATATSGGGVTASTFNMTSITKQPHKEDKCRGGSGGGNKGHHGSHGQHHNKGGHRSKSSRAAGGMEEDKICPICLDEFTNPTRTKCGHQFCSGCLEKALKYDPFCPTCKQALRPIIGKQPQGGQMTHRILYGQSLSGYQGYNTIQIDYSIPGGVQGPEHPNPGRRFSGTSRTAYLPGNYEGREVLQLLKKAFDARLIFTVGTSVTSGAQNTVVWNDIHHKTSMYGGAYGYPDATYLQRVKEDLAAKGIVPDSSAV